MDPVHAAATSVKDLPQHNGTGNTANGDTMPNTTTVDGNADAGPDTATPLPPPPVSETEQPAESAP